MPLQWCFRHDVKMGAAVPVWYMSKAEGGAEVAEDGGRRPCESYHSVVVAAGRAEKTQLSRTTGAATVARFPTRVQRAMAFQRGQWWPNVVVVAAECGDCGVGWCGRERIRRLRLGFGCVKEKE